jgi:transcriptional regulator with XRE-family HTH domain/predicted negative regulator of RcsB-dependent stress response
VDSASAVGERIRALRVERNLRQRDLAFEGCTPAYISRIEAGARIPSLQLLREIGKRLGVSADYLATGSIQSTSMGALQLADAQLSQRLGELGAAEAAFRRLLVEHEEGSVRRGALLGLAQLTLARGEIRDSIELLEEFDRHGGYDGPVDAAAVETLAHAYATSGDLAAALAFLERNLASADHPLTHFRLAVIMANVLIDLRQFDRAETLIGDTLAGLGEAADPISVARCLWSQSRLQTARGNNDLAVGYAEQALSVIRTTEHEEYAARAHQVLAYIELERGHPERAIALLDEALPLVVRGGDQTLLATFNLERARALLAVDQLDQAHELASQLVRQLEGLSSVDSVRALSILAEVYARTDEPDRALALYEAAADQLAGHENEAMLIDVYRQWSDLLAETGDTHKALEIARRAIATRQSVPS